MKFKTNLKISNTLIDMTPLVDVIFLMLIFFIVTSDVLPLKSLNIENPTLNRNSAPLTTQILVVMDAQNVIYVGSKKTIVELGGVKAQVQEEIDILSQKGVNVTEIEQQTKTTEDKIVELDKRLEELPNVRDRLVEKYREEKEEQLKNNESRDYLEERRVENSLLFNTSKNIEIRKEIKEKMQI